MFYFRVFELLRCFIIGFANTRTVFETEIECSIIEFSCISIHVMDKPETFWFIKGTLRMIFEWPWSDLRLGSWISLSVWSIFFVLSYANHWSCSKCGEIYGWTNWSECSASFNGTMSRQRACHRSPYGRNCYYGTEFVLTDSRECNMETYRKLTRKTR